MAQAAIVFLMFVLLFIFTRPKPKPQNKQPTIEDIKRKYPSRKSQEQIKAEKLNQRRAEYDRDLANRMRARGASPVAPQNSKYVAKYKKLLAMLNGDKKAADRLISAYGVDRAISDLERDRR